MEIQHFSHEHLLVLDRTETDGETCNLCSSAIDYLAFACFDCGFLLHEKCAKLPRETKSRLLHPQHTLVLVPNHPDPLKPLKCSVCGKTCPGFVFRCGECDYNVDVSCFMRNLSDLNLPSREKTRKIHHFTHQHSLILRYCPEKNPAGLSCRGCEKPVSGPTYFCPECPKFCLHKSCSQFPEQIQHPFHPSHPLVLNTKSPYPSGKQWCDACRKDIKDGYIFHCSKCGFDLDLTCASRAPSLKHGKHSQHPLEFFELTFLELVCSVCGKGSTERIYRCVPCKFNVHSSCLTFASTVKHNNHRHPLSLKESITKGNSGWFPCEVCKKSITPKHPVYYCEQCSYGVHIECIDPEVTSQIFSKD
ncbi:hypothetical protein CDL15_Pgr018675 [Punica granatum]|uniref:Phorbol-ester/DAG-type domain-containing protein n=1 Tax=Punica granatum TaxID=22663 RepID=A0A218VU73_PUNGR|nr:hypothetical protein CDL15_Pgr018675 [Punica granatum]